MGRILGKITHNKLYVALAIFIILVNLIVFLDKAADRAKEEVERPVAEETLVEEKKDTEKRILFDEEEYKIKRDKIEELAQTSPRLYLFLGLFNLFIIFLIFIGVILDGYFLRCWLRKKPLAISADTHDQPRWTIIDIVRVVLVFFAFGYLFVIFQAVLAKWFPLLKNDNFRMILDTAMMNLVGISVILYFVVRKYGQNVSSIGLTVKNFSKNVFYAIVGYISLIPVLLGIMIITFFVIKWLAYKPPVQPIVQVFLEEERPLILLISTLFAAIFGPIAEEIFFRGFMYGAIRKTFGIFWAMMITSAVFSLLHAHIVGFLPIMALGMLLAYLYERTGSLVSSMSVHIIHNVGMVALVFIARSIGAY